MSLASFEAVNLFSVKGKVAVVTGGGTGIGRAITTGLAVNGAKVFIIGRRSEILDSTAKAINEYATMNGGQVVAVEGDIATKKGIEPVYEKLAGLTEKVDYLVNSAGDGAMYKVQADINDPIGLEKKLWSIEDSDFLDMATYYMSSPWLLSVKLIPLLQKSNDPVISNITSLAGVGVERMIAHPAYASAKAAELHLTKLMAANFITFKIRVNSLSPGLFKSQMTTGSSDAETPVAPVVEQVVKTFPSGREGTWEEIAGVALMLASPAGAHINGADILIDGGGKMVMSAA